MLLLIIHSIHFSNFFFCDFIGCSITALLFLCVYDGSKWITDAIYRTVFAVGWGSRHLCGFKSAKQQDGSAPRSQGWARGKKKKERRKKRKRVWNSHPCFQTSSPARPGPEEQETCFALGTVKQWLYRLKREKKTTRLHFQNTERWGTKKSESGAGENK